MTNNNTALRRDRLVGVFLIIIGLLIGLETKLMQVKMKLARGDAGPKLFLYISAVGLVICGIGILCSKTSDTKMLRLAKEQWKKFFLVFFAFVAYLLGLYILGFMISTPIAIFGFIYILKQEKKINFITLAIYSVALTFLLYVIFEKILAIILPSGLFF